MKRFLLTCLLLFAGNVFAANYEISTGTTTVDGDSFCSGTCQPGDTLTFATGARGDILFRDLDGAAGNNIIIRNPASEQTIINCSGTFCVEFIEVYHVTMDGTNKWAGAPAGGCGSTFITAAAFAASPSAATADQQCGIKLQCSSGGSQQMLGFRGLTNNTTIQGLEVDGGFPSCRPGPPGTAFTGHNNTINVDTNPGDFWQGNKYLHNFLHDMSSECMYIGGNIKTPRRLPMRDMEYGWNIVFNCGYDGIEIKSHTVAGAVGNSQMHHNFVAIVGIGSGTSNGNNGIGISIYESGFIDVHHNWVQDTFPPGTKSGNCFGTLIQNVQPSDAASLTVTYYNNVAVDCAGHGINGFQKAITNSEVVNIVFNNTTINVGKSGVNFSSNVEGSGFAQDNIACGSANADINDSSIGGATTTFNTTGACSSVGFENLVGRDFHLTSDTNNGGNYSSPPDDDYDGISRPQGLGDDRGAYEFDEGGGPPPGEPGITSPKPDPHSVDSGETWHPDYLWVINEGTGTTLEDDGSATDCDMTITGADWASDALGPYLSFVSANSDFAENTSCTALAGSSVTRSMCTVVRIVAPTGTTETYSGMFDASDADQQFELRTTTGLGYPQVLATQSGAGGSNTVEFIGSQTDDELHMVCAVASDTVLKVSLNGANFQEEVQALTGLYTGIDTVAIGAARRLVANRFADAHIYAMWIYTATLTNANVITIYNDGDPWPIIGVDPASGPPPVLPRGGASHAAGVIN